MSAATILLVDDDEVLGQVLRRVLERAGYRVVTAGTAAQALQLAREQRPALALLDLRLPDSDGVELARRLEEEVGHFPLLLMTAYPLRLRDHPELARGFAHVLTKPLNLDELRQTIEKALAPGEPADESVPSAIPVTKPVSSPAAAPASLAGTPAPARRRRYRWVVAGAVTAAVLALLLVLPVLGTPGLGSLFRPAGAASAPEEKQQASLLPEAVARRLHVSRDAGLELPPEVADHLGVTAMQVRPTAAPWSLELAGSLAFNPNRLGRVQARFPGEVISITEIDEPAAGPGGTTGRRELRYGDFVRQGQVLAVVLSNTLGEKKSELVDALVQLDLDEQNLRYYEKLVQSGALPEAKLRDQRRIVAQDRNAVARAELTLRTWRVPQDDIEAVKKEARTIGERNGRRNLDKETDWARVEVRAPFDGTIVEKNVALHNIVDTTFDLFKVADLTRLGVMVHAYEEDLRALLKLRRGHPWEVRLGADPRARVLTSDGLQQLGFVIDPNQHTDPVMGLVDNPRGDLRVGQFVTATVEVPPPPAVVAVPVAALDETGGDSFVFVQPDPQELRYVLRRVLVVERFRNVVYIRNPLTRADRERGLQTVEPREWVITAGVVELRAALDDLKARAKQKQ
jgi:cobalt-zinc-cadmium efflux system membrane fusion protein